MRIYLAPIRGITDCIYRNTFSRYFHGVDVAVAPFISSVMGRKIKDSYLADILPDNNKNMLVIPQILTKNAADFLFMAERIFAIGCTEINWNLGCPAPMVANKQRGSGLLPHPDKICQILDKVLADYPDKISIKVRLGRMATSELEELLPRLDQYPLREIIIHPRLGVQMYKGVADHNAFGHCMSLTSHKLVYNGDIVDLSSFDLLQNRFNEIDNWMIGRGLLFNPFLADQIKNRGICLKIGNDADILKSFHDDLLDQYRTRLCGDSHVMGRMKGIWVYFADYFVNPVKIRKKINKTTKIAAYEKVVKDVFHAASYQSKEI